MTTSLESSMATFHFASATAAVASATGFLINKLDVSNNDSSDKKIQQNKICMPERIYNPIMAMGFSAIFTFLLNNTKR